MRSITNPAQPLFIVTVDTEADDAWAVPKKIELDNLKQVPRFQELCENYGVIPTYLITYECATRDEATCVLKPIFEGGQCEIGHHLHSWTTPPFDKEGVSGVDSAWLHAYQSELPDSLFREKAECLRNAIENTYGRSPTSHRAGRWGIDQRSIDWLIDNGFIAESSVTPLISWANNVGKTAAGPSFYSCPREPYFWHGKSTHNKDRTALLEIPVTVDAPQSILPKACLAYLQRPLPAKSIVDHLYRRMGGGTMLRPSPRYAQQAPIGIIDRAIRCGVPVLNLMIHSSELALGCSPFSRSKEECTQVWKRLEAILRHVRAIGVTPVTLSGAEMWLRESANSQATRSRQAAR